MRFTSLVALAVAPLVLAANFNVNVGQSNTFAFSPTSITGAVAGDTITFTFLSRNHSATSTTFTTPCPPPAGGVAGSFDTGFFDATTGTKTTVVTLTSSNTQWIACRQANGGHCRLGMTFAINPTSSQTYEQFLLNAMRS
ncbi:hypothetical protein ONZ45_g1618 [Pleurotus djamor]|nr:hypothetical protein ONZ45_g1618 [Pleurotus djamor]